MTHYIHLLLSTLSSLLRLGQGFFAGKPGAPPAQPPIIYEFEGCPHCRKVREAVTALDLVVDIRPCPKGGARFRPELIRRGGKAQFPYLVDPNTGIEMYESYDIIRYLFEHYGSGRRPFLLMLGPITDLLMSLAMIPRIGFGTYAKHQHREEGVQSGSEDTSPHVILRGYESQPAARLLREKLCVLEVPYRLIPTALGSRHRGSSPVLALDDGETRQLTECAAALDYLEQSYG